jgi:hypothetical protein
MADRSPANPADDARQHAQLARRPRAEVIGIAGQANHDWLTTHGIKPVTYGDGLATGCVKTRLMRSSTPTGKVT